MATVHKLQIVLEATTTAFEGGLRKAQDSLQGFASKTDKLHAKMERFQKKHRETLSSLQAIGAASAVGLVAIGAGIKATTDEAMKFESAMAEVKKVVNFESPDGIKQMRAELEELSTRVPIAFDGLAKIAAAAGQSGIAANEIVKFTEAAAKMGTAFDITAEQAGQAMAEMRTAFKMSQAEVETLADKINYLGNNSPNAAAKIMEVVQRIGPLGEIAGVSADQIAAMAASLTSVEPDVAATGLKNMMLQLVKGESLSKSAKAAFDDLGLSYTEIAKGMQTDSIGTINKVFEAIKKLPEEAQAATINDIFGSESIAVISQLINGTDTLGKHLQAMGDASKYAGSMSQEAANINDTSAAKMEMFKNATQNAKAAIGDAFLPTLGALAEALLPVINGIKQFAQENPTMVTAITGIVGGVLVLGTALGAIGLAVPLVTTALGGLTDIARLAGTAIGGISLPVVAVVVAIAALVAAGVWLYNNWDMVKAKATEVWNAIPQYASQAWQWIQGVWSGVGAWFGGIWDSISATASGVWQSIVGAFGDVGAWFGGIWDGVVSAVSTAWDMVKLAIITKINEIKQAFTDWLATAPAPVQEMVANIISIFTGMATLASVAWSAMIAVSQTVIDAVVSLWQGFKDIVSSLWASVVSVAQSVWGGIVSIAQSIRDSVVSVWRTLTSALSSVWASVVSAVSSAWQGIVSIASNVWNSVKSTVTSAINAIKPVISSISAFFSAAWQGLVAVASSVWSAIKAAAMLGIAAIKASLTAGVTGFAVIFNAGFNAVKTVVSTAFNAIKALVRGDINGVKTAIQSGLSQLAGIARNAMSQMVSAITSIGGRLRQAGSEIVQGLINGISAKMEAAVAKIREMASRMKSAVTGFFDINSPSRVMKQIGEWVSEGMAIGIAYKAPMAADEAKKLAEATKKAFDDEIKSLDRSILVNKLKLQGDPNAEFTADVVSGKYGDTKNLDKLYQTKQQALDLEQQVKAMESFDSTMADIQRQIALMGNDNPIKEMMYDFEHKHKYVGYTVEQMQELEKQLTELGKAKVNADFASELKKSTDELNKQQYLLNNIGDKYAELRYGLAQKGFDTSQIDHIVGNTEQSDLMTQFKQWDAQNRQKAIDSNPLAKLQADFDAEMALITSFNQQKLLANEEYLQRKQDLEAQHEAQTQALKIAGYESQLSLASGLAKDLLGESSRGYKAIFAMEKGMAVARVLMDNKVALAKAWASAPFPQNLPAVGTTLVKTGALAAAVNAIRPVIGQAHDGIMSVPKSGTWNLEKGERVLPKHTAKALDDKLDSMGNGGTVNNISVNVSVDSNGGDVTSDHAFGKRLGDIIKTTVQQELMREKRQGGALYGV